MRAAIYARFSTENQNEASIEDQVRGCQALAKAQGFEIARVYTDRAVSGGTHQRAAYQELLQAASRRDFDVIVAEDISRLWRNRADYGSRSAEFEDLGIHLVTCVGDDTRRDGWGLVLGIKQAIAEHQRREISYRTRRGLEGRALAGASTGGRTFGYSSVSTVDPEQAAVVREIFSMAASGESAARICRALNGAGFHGPRGGDWSASTVIAILNNPRYTGRVIWGAHEFRKSATDSRRITRRLRESPTVDRLRVDLRIVPEQLWFAAQAALQSRRIVHATAT